ncbi:MAG: hypothetical protein AB1567_03280 [bacterium]
MAGAVAERVSKKEDLIKKAEYLQDIEFRKLVKEEAKNAVSLEEIQKILSKVNRSLSEMVIEERKKGRW